MYGGGGEFDGSAAAFMGGGFMPTQATQAPESSFSSSKNRETRCLLPLTVRQVQLASNEDSNFVVDGVEVNNVTVVGRVCRREDKASEFSFAIDDGTGQIECTKWIQELTDSEEMEGVLMGMYVRVHGLLKGLQGRRTINVFSVRPVTDFNEITSHFVECIYVHYYNTRIKGNTFQPPMPKTINTPLNGYQGIPRNQSYPIGAGDGLSNISQMILNFLQQPIYVANENGAHRSVIAQQLQIPMDKLMEEMQGLIDNGLAYSTIDDDHFKTTVNA